MMDKIKKNSYETVASDEDKKADLIPLKYGYGIRHIQVLLIFCSLCVNFIARAHLSVTIVAMTDIPKKNNNIVFNTTIRENFRTFSEFGLKNASDNSQITDVKNDTILDLYKANSNGLVTETDALDAVNKLNKSNDDIILELTNVNSTLNEEMHNDANLNLSIWNIYRKYSWSKAIQEMVLGSFFLGYMIMMSPMGLICQRWGGKLPLQIGLTVSGVIAFLTPWLAAWGGWKAVCASRIATGLAQAGTYPGTNTLVAKWVPLSERGRLGTYVYIGSMIGAVLAFQLGGFLAESPLDWPSTFWVTGGLCITMAILMTVFGAASPQQHKSITDLERNFILGRVCTGIEKDITRWSIVSHDLHNELCRLFAPVNYHRIRRHQLMATAWSRTVARAKSPIPRSLCALNSLLATNPECDLLADGWSLLLLRCLCYCEGDA
ncbi:ascorbate transporter, chloroplastic-like [Hyposmocoma kahamanoa]|uniref:ascorbate transporter, chloroplastic-like n=1 Tax=Hyposmocoma kahamanoa TaxID=1477025 RepID=UPI000E6D73C0|nr:ascorbate transporter, chloroplastic-like [Hyposmocoma kahamanoa]